MRSVRNSDPLSTSEIVEGPFHFSFLRAKRFLLQASLFNRHALAMVGIRFWMHRGQAVQANSSRHDRHRHRDGDPEHWRLHLHPLVHPGPTGWRSDR